MPELTLKDICIHLLEVQQDNLETSKQILEALDNLVTCVKATNLTLSEIRDDL